MNQDLKPPSFDVLYVIGNIYQLDSEYLKLRKYKDGVATFDVTDSQGIKIEPTRNANGLVDDYRVRVITNRLNELKWIEI
jgi:hypothetical protein